MTTNPPHYKSFTDVESDVSANKFENEPELRQAFIEALKAELLRACPSKNVVEHILIPFIERTIKERRRPDIRIINLVIEVEPPKADLKKGREQLYQYMKDLRSELKAEEVHGVVTNGIDAEHYKLVGEEPVLVAKGRLAIIMPPLLQRICVKKIPVTSSQDLINIVGIESNLAQNVIIHLYRALKWYHDNRGAPFSSRVLQLFELWRSLHAIFVNISDEGWSAIIKLAEEIGRKLGTTINIKGKNDRWLFLFSLETYLNMLIRNITLSKIGQATRTVKELKDVVTRKREIFEPSVFEWVFDVLEDQYLENNIKNTTKNSIDALIEVLYALDFTRITTDMFRDIYQNILPREVRKCLGEFYTSDLIVEQVLDAAGLTSDALRQLYEKWKEENEGTIILDPACGSGSFLVNVIKRIFNAFGEHPPRDIARFIEESLVGIDINPFAVEMAKLNMIIAISSEMSKRGLAYTPVSLKIYWADSLAKVKLSKERLYYHLMVIELPALQNIIGNVGGKAGTGKSKSACPPGTICIPLCSSAPSKRQRAELDPLKMLDRAIEYVFSSKDVKEFIQHEISEFNEKCKMDLKDVLRPILEALYNTIKAIYDSGNSRIISMIRNIVGVQNLVGKCSYVIGNPPWVRIHNIGKNIVEYLKRNYEWVKEGSSYTPGFKETKTPFAEQFDYSIVFVERGLEFLSDGGVLAYVITSKVTKTTYAGKMREDLVNKCTILEIVDYSLHPQELFKDVVNYPLIISIRKSPPPAGHRVKVTVYNTRGDSRSFTIEQSLLPLYAGTPYPNKDRSPWVFAPPGVVSALKRVVANNPRLGDLYEVMMGVKTSLNEYYIGKPVSCNESLGLVEIQLENGRIVEVEESLVHPVVRGEDIDSYSFSWREYIIFPHDLSTLEPLWHDRQKEVLTTMGVLKQDVKVGSKGGVLEYTLKYEIGKESGNCRHLVDDVLSKVKSKGYDVKDVVPCSVDKCIEVVFMGGTVLRINISIKPAEDVCEVTYHVAGLEVPNAPKATRYFTQLFERLVKRDDYRANLPPWSIFRVSKEKFEEYRIAWREMALYAKAAHLPVSMKIAFCGERQKLIVPIQTTYFIVEKDPSKALKLLIYLNSDLVRSLIKLWAWSARGGYYRHTAYTMGLIPIPSSLISNKLWKLIDDQQKHLHGVVDFNKIAKDLLEENMTALEEELIQTFGITQGEYKEIIEYSKWLNETVELHIETMALEEESSEAE